MSLDKLHEITPRLAQTFAIVLFVFTLIAFVTETQLTQYVQTTLQYRQPFFLFYLVHSSFWMIYPLHLLYLHATTRHSIPSLNALVATAIGTHLDYGGVHGPSNFPVVPFLRLVLSFTVGLTLPGLLWFAAVSLASVSDVTAIWNANAFFAYVISVKLLHLDWEPKRLVAVLIATLGTLIVVYGGSVSSESPEDPQPSPQTSPSHTLFQKPSAPLIGNFLTLIASVGYGFYQVLYKKYATLPSNSDRSSRPFYEQLPPQDLPVEHESPHESEMAIAAETLPFGLYPNMFTSALGLCTVLFLWIPLPILHFTGLEVFRLPDNMATVFAIAGIAFSGMVFNAGFMVLLGVWGPIVTSVGNLLTIVLVFISDILFGAGLQAVTLWGLVGSGAIIFAFGVLVHDMLTKVVA